jgi:hypothetical protein
MDGNELASKEDLGAVLSGIRKTLDQEASRYAHMTTITITSDSNKYLQPKTDYEVYVLIDDDRSALETNENPGPGALEAIADALPKRFEKNGHIYTVHVETDQEHLQRHIDDRD